jgi:hypothetical protein
MKHKIYLSLTDAEYKTLKSMVQSSTFDKSNNLILQFPAKENKDDYIKLQVYSVLSDFSRCDPNKFNDSSDLKQDLGLALYHKQALKNSFQNIIQHFRLDGYLTVKECEGLVKVGDCIKLIKSKL